MIPLLVQTPTTAPADGASRLLDGDTLRAAGYLLLFFVAVFWVATAFWVYKDARRRIDDPWLVLTATLLGLVPPFVGPLIYMLFRPPEYLDDVRERELEIQAMEEELARTQRELDCPVCHTAVEPAFLVCPVCTTKLRQACATCKAPLEPLWQVCPFCETPVDTPTAVRGDSWDDAARAPEPRKPEARRRAQVRRPRRAAE